MIGSTNTQTLIDFDTDVANVFQIGAGDNAGGATTQVGESDQWNMHGTFNSYRFGGLLTAGAAMMYQYQDGGVATTFGVDPNGDGDVNDLYGSNRIGAEQASDLAGASSNGLLLSVDGDFASSAFYIRIKNDTGQTITDWNFAADVLYEESESSASTATFGYAIDNGLVGTSMTFTGFGNASAATSGATYATTAYGLDETLTTAGVADGEYIVLGFFDQLNNSHGSGIVIDNIGITALTAVPEPGSLSLFAVAGLCMSCRRRRSVASGS